MCHRGLPAWHGQQGSHGHGPDHGAALRQGIRFRFFQRVAEAEGTALSWFGGNLGPLGSPRPFQQGSERHRGIRARRGVVGLCAHPVRSHRSLSRLGILAAGAGIRLRELRCPKPHGRMAPGSRSSGAAGGNRIRDDSSTEARICWLLVLRHYRAEFECHSVDHTNDG